jgi:hypothetical protein
MSDTLSPSQRSSFEGSIPSNLCSLCTATAVCPICHPIHLVPGKREYERQISTCASRRQEAVSLSLRIFNNSQRFRVHTTERYKRSETNRHTMAWFETCFELGVVDPCSTASRILHIVCTCRHNPIFDSKARPRILSLL